MNGRGSVAALALLLAAGCAHLESRAAAPHDDRIVVVEFRREGAEACQILDGYFGDDRVRQALEAIRLVRYDVDSYAGGAAYERLVGSPMSGMSTVGDVIWAHRTPLLLVLVDDRVIRRFDGVPPDAVALAAWLQDVAPLGGTDAPYAAALAGGEADDGLLLRGARWLDAHRRGPDALLLWRRLDARVDATPDVSAEAAWNVGRAERHGHPRDPRATLAFAAQHPSTAFARRALAVAAIVMDLPPAEVAAALRVDFDAATALGFAIEDVFLALAAHQYGFALQAAEELVRSTKGGSAPVLGAFAEVMYYRQEAGAAVDYAKRALLLSPQSPWLRADAERYRRSNGQPSPHVESLRAQGLADLPRFYGDLD